MLEFAGNAERGAEVEMPDPKAIDAVHRGDIVGILDARCSLDLGEEARSFVRRLQSFAYDSRVPVGVMRDAERDAAPAGRHVFEVGHELARLVGRVDHRHHHGFRAHVGGPRHLVVCLGGNAHDGRKLRCLEISHCTLDRLEAEAGMLGVEQDEVAARASQEMADAGSCELDDEMAEFRLAAAAEPF